MPTIEKTIDVKVPINLAYNQWTQFEAFPNFMPNILKVTQLDDTHISWVADAGARTIEWQVEIVEQVPDHHIAWRSVSGGHNSGVVSFQHVDPHSTRVRLEIKYENTGQSDSSVRTVLEEKIKEDLELYRQLLESRKAPTGGWRGHISRNTDKSIKH
ncbi:SRPBCC family protein [Methylobacillus arboreus]|uniref:SRPBCC family protein n=1 Tax=Methylobacillus arboreus TaxID=755170 RepID=UPI001E5FB4CE|nr:SRPBCC family protein [Methylobacillus arboreus]MCB5189805.1 SRPBCC family protein [Methylobacillus arboreus]